MLRYTTPTKEADNYKLLLQGISNLLPVDNLPLIGKSSRFPNIYYNLAISDLALNLRLSEEERKK